MIDRRYDSGKKFVMYSQEELEMARHTDLIDFLGKHEGFSFKTSGNWFIGLEHDSLVINPDRYTWHWYSRDLYGKGAIDWLCKVDGYGFQEAVARLIGSNGIRDSPRKPPAKQHYPKNEQVEFTPPKKMEGRCRELYAYLNITRKLPADIITYCVHNKLLYEDITKRAVFCGYDKNGKMMFAEDKILNTYNHYYPHNIPGSKKEYSFYIPATPEAYGYDPTLLYVFESPIDLLSHGALMQMAMKKECCNRNIPDKYRPDCWLAINRLALSGLNYVPIDQRLADDPRIESIVLCLDNDVWGQQMDDRVMEKYSDRYNVKVIKPPYGKDWNDALKNAVSIQLNNNKI